MTSPPRFSTFVMPAVFGVALVLSLVRVTATATHEYFVEKPHLIEARGAGLPALTWLSPDSDADWLVRYRSGASAKWRQVTANMIKRVPGDEIRMRRVYEAVLDHLSAGQAVEIEVLRNGTETFKTNSTAPLMATSSSHASGL